jgi:glycine/D-amino acid oxidase-like deaminating enzyme
MIGEADAVVVGAGALGASIAFHLAKTGKLRVALIDKHELASQTSPRAAGLTAQVRTTDVMTRLAMLAVKKIERFEDETGEPLVYYRSGSLKIARTPEDYERLQRDVTGGRRLGLEIDFISAVEARRLLPFLEPAHVRGITFTPADLYLEPVQIPLGYARAAGRLGATLLPHTAVTGIVTRNGAVEGVMTDQGTVRTPVVVDAAGAWTRLVARMANGRVAAVPTRHQLLVTEPIEGVVPTLPIARVIDSNVYVRPEKGGLLLGGYEQDPVQYDMHDLPATFQIKDLSLDIGVLRRLADSVVTQFPILREFKVREHRGGLPTMTVDGRLIVGPVPGVRGFFVAGGCCVGGLSIAPAIGEVLAEWIRSGESPLDLTLMSPERFGPEYEVEERLRAQCRWQYAHHYSAP